VLGAFGPGRWLANDVEWIAKEAAMATLTGRWPWPSGPLTKELGMSSSAKAVVGLLVGAGVVGMAAARYRSSIQAAYDRLGAEAWLLPSPYGDIEYAHGGAGPPVLVVHGAGGGCDQGELVAKAVLGEGFHWIAPSRFGYLRSTFHRGASWDDQAHAFAYLLDHLGLARVAVVALSARGPSALLLALLHPDRVASLTLISCGGARIPLAQSKLAHWQGWALLHIVDRDFPYWLLTSLFRKRFLTLMGADQRVVAGLSRPQREVIDRFVECMNPASRRHVGALFDHTAAVPDRQIAAIEAPTLVIHAEDDTLQPYQNAAFFCATIPGARLLRFPAGGHFVGFIEQATVRAAVQRHILDNASDSAVESAAG
jgi:pimeloyl-ACP methyl ester carboxylesterase